MTVQDAEIAVLIELHRGLERQGPGDAAFSRRILDELEAHAQRLGLAHLVEPIEADIGRLDWPAGSIDLLWSEGAAYNLGFATALRRWRPLLAPGGVAVISELSWFGDDIPAPARTYWEHAYPKIGSEAENIAHAGAQGFEVLGVHRLPAAAWWNNYYGPLQLRIDALRGQVDAAMQAVIRETEAEIALFRDYSEAYGYAYYVLRARA